ncbi:MAG: protein O-mannosyl-transferase family [Candidatus Kryptoniota bacterium]
MNYKRLNRLIALSIFLLTLVMYAMTAQSSVPFWDCGEFAATSTALEVPHPPGAPLWTLLGRLAMMVPVKVDPALKINLVSGLASALTIMFLYLIAVRIITRWRSFPSDTLSSVIVFGSAAIGALTFSVTDTFWFNAVESEVYATSMLFVSSVVWLGLLWFEKADEADSERYLLLIAYLMGLSIGVHQLSLLAFFTVALLIYFKYHEFELRTFIYFGIITILSFAVIYPVIVEWLPGILDGEVQIGPIHITNSVILQLTPLALVILAIYWIFRAERLKQKIVSVSIMAALLVVLGYSTYTLVLIRANAHPPINENNPGTLTDLVNYLNRVQYGEQPSIFNRRWDKNDPQHAQNYQKYESDWDFFWKYQLNHMYLRYLGWNFIGRAGDIQDAPVAFIKAPAGWYDGTRGYPARYFGIPLFIALFGIWYHFKRDWKFAFSFLAMFIVMGLALVVYFNMYEPQPRERDYFFVGSFFVIALWISTGTAGIVESTIERLNHPEQKVYVALVTVIVLFAFSPMWMYAQNEYTHDRRGNYVPWDYSYNILQSCKKDAILFTNGDNDTFPLWYLQEVMGIRTDIRIVNLSLLNTDWYILQLKNETPHGAKKVPISISDNDIKSITPIEWRTTTFKLPVPPDVFHQFGITDTNIINRGYVEYTVRPTIGGGQVQGIRVQDLLVKNIIETNKWQQPVYFAVTVAPDNFDGFGQYLQMQGLALQLTPLIQRGQNEDYRIDPNIMKQCLLYTPGTFHREPHYGFLFRNLNNPHIYYDENARRLTLNYRNSFMRLAAYYLSHGENQNAVATLDTMEARIPIKVIPLDYRIVSDIARLYFMAGAKSRFEKYAVIVEEDARKAIEQNPADVQTPYNPYRILLDLYDMQGAYQKEIDLLKKLQGIFPQERSIQDRISQLQELILMQGKNQPDTAGKR